MTQARFEATGGRSRFTSRRFDEDCELIASVARDEHVRSARPPQPVGDLDEDPVARGMPMRVVASLKPSRSRNTSPTARPVGAWVVPLAGGYVVTARFRDVGPHWATAHIGVDLAAPLGRPVVAAAGG